MSMNSVGRTFVCRLYGILYILLVRLFRRLASVCGVLP